MFKRNFPENDNHRYLVQDLGLIAQADLPSDLDIAWASFPCTDLSLAGGRAGLHRGAASSTFWHFIKVLSRLGDARPGVVALENVTAFATSHSGRDLVSAIRALNGLGYSVDVLNIDARHFVPQSRPRLFLIGSLSQESHEPQTHPFRPLWLNGIYDDESLLTHQARLPTPPSALSDGLADFVEPMDDHDQRWWSVERVQKYIESLSPIQRSRFDSLSASAETIYRTAYRRMRDGVPRWEMRNDGIAGCLRTASGGSSKQALVKLGRGTTQIRWMTPTEYAGLMGAPNFPLEGIRANQAYSGFGDAVCAPVVEWLSKNYLVPLMESANRARALTAPERALALQCRLSVVAS